MSSSRSRKLSPSAKSSPLKAKPTQIDLKVEVPAPVTDMAKKFWNKIWNSSCPFASLFVWVQVLMAIYYLFLMPDISVKLDQDKVKAEKVSRSLRGWLFLVSIGCGFLGYMIISQGCDKAGPQWSVLWFIAAVILSWFITRLILASVEKTTLTNASDILKQMN